MTRRLITGIALGVLVMLIFRQAEGAVTQVGSTNTVNCTGTTSVSCTNTTPVGCANGNLLLVWLSAFGASKNITSFTAAGYTGIDDTGTAQNRYGDFYLKLSSAPAATYVFAAARAPGGASTMAMTSSLSCWTGIDPTTFLDTHSIATGAATPAVGSTITLGGFADTLLSIFGNGADTSTFSAPTGTVSAWSYTSNRPSSYGFSETAGPGATGTRSSNMGTSGNWGAALVGLMAPATPTPTPTSTPVPTSTPTFTPVPTSTQTETPVPTSTETPVPTATATPSTPTATPTGETPTATPEPTQTATPEPTQTATPEPTFTQTPVPTDTQTPAPTFTQTPVPTQTATQTPVPTPSPTPGGVGSFWTTQYNNNMLLQFPQLANGNQAPSLSFTSGVFSLTADVAVDWAHNIWVADYTNFQIFKFPAGSSGILGPSVTIGGPSTTLRAIGSIAFDRDGNLWVANTGANTILEFTASQLVSGGDVAPAVTIGLNFPLGIAFDQNNNMYATTGWSFGGPVAIVEYASTDLTTENWRITGTNTTFDGDDPGMLGVMGDGSVYFVDQFDGTVLRFNAGSCTHGTTPCNIAPNQTITLPPGSDPGRAAVNWNTNDVYVADYNTNTVFVYDNAGNLIRTLVGAATTLNGPWGIGLDVPTPTPSPTPTPTVTPTPTPTATNTPVPTDTAKATPAPTDTPVPTNTPTFTPAPTFTPVPTSTATFTPVPTQTPTFTPVPTSTPTFTPVPTATGPTATPSPTPIPNSGGSGPCECCDQ